MNDFNYVSGRLAILIDPYGLSPFTDATDFTSDVTGNMSSMMGGPLGSYNWGSNGKVYAPSFHGNQYVGIQGNIGNVGTLLGVGSTLLQAPGYYDKMVNSQSYGEYGGYVGEWTGSALGGMAGAEAGASAGAAIGAAVGVWFGGVGAAPGALIGGVIGGLVGGIGGAWGGGKAGKWAGEKIGGHFDPHSDCDQNTPKINWPKRPSSPLGDFEYSPGPNPFPNSRIVIV